MGIIPQGLTCWLMIMETEDLRRVREEDKRTPPQVNRKKMFSCAATNAARFPVAPDGNPWFPPGPSWN
jgi:hypothetical protein